MLAFLSALQNSTEVLERTRPLRESFKLADLPELWIVVLVLVPAAFAISWIGYGRESIGANMRSLLVGLRFLALLLLMAVLARPVLVQQREEVQEAEVLVLLDDSASMRRVDAYGADQDRSSKLARFAGSSDVASVTRLQLQQTAVQAELLPMLTEGGYLARSFRFGGGLAALAEEEQLSGREAATHLGDSLTQAITAHRGRHVTDIVVLSDGRSNGGLAPIEAARAASSAGIPVHTIVVGDTRPERNAVVELVEAPASALSGDEVAVLVRVLGRGTRGEFTQVVLEELQDGYEPELVAEERVTLTESGERVLLLAAPKSEGRAFTRRFRVSLPPLEDETLLDDNTVEFSVRITPEKIRVLYVDGYPRWEYRYLKNLLLRADDNLEAHIFLLSATPNFVQESSRGLPALEEVPTTREQLLQNYDVIILGDVDPLAISYDPERGAEFVKSLREFVESGGGLLMQAGESDNPESFVLSPELQELMPVVLDPTKGTAFDEMSEEQFHPRLEDSRTPHEIVRLHPELDVNQRLWEDEEGLHGFYWYKAVERAKPGAQVLLRHPSRSTAGTGERDPLLVAGYYPSGRTLFLAMDSTWRWRFRFGDRYHERFWRNAIRWLSLGRLKSGNRRVQLESPRSNYNLGERVSLEARVLDTDFRPSDASRQSVTWAGPDGDERNLDLSPEPGRPGIFIGSFEPERAGLHSAWFDLDGERAATVEFEVLLPTRENSDPTPDAESLKELALATGGSPLELFQIADLKEQFPGNEERREPISSKLEDIWDSLWTLLAALGLLSAEWILRKRHELI